MIKELWNKDMFGFLTLCVSLIGIGFVVGSTLTSRDEFRIMEYQAMIDQQSTNECIRQYNEYVLEMQH